MKHPFWEHSNAHRVKRNHGSQPFEQS